jgi:dipeptidyl aminopeptidase/acylaminoacyl peptidase
MPDGRHYLYIVQPGNIMRFGTLGSTDTRDLGPTDGRPIYSISGHLLYGAQAFLQARPFDPVRGEFTGDTKPIAEGVRMLAANARATYTVSDTGIVVYRAGLAETQSRIQWYDRAGKPLSEAVAPGDYRSLSLSPDGTRVAYHRHDVNDGGGIWLKDLTRGTTTRVTFGAHTFGETWHPDGRHIAFVKSARPIGDATDTVTEIAMTAANGTGDVEAVVASKATNMWPVWSPDGRVLIYQVGTSYNSPSDIWVMPMDTRKPVPFIHGAANEGQPAFSPDGRWVAYMSDETGRPEVYVQPYPANGDKFTISTAGGIQPQWRADGKELFFLSATRQMQAVDIGVKGDRFEAGAPRTLFTTRAALVAGPLGPYRVFGVAADGQSFVVDELPPDAGQRHDPLVVIVNWTSLLRR